MTWPRPPPEPSLARTTEGRCSSMPLVSPVPVGQEASTLLEGHKETPVSSVLLFGGGPEPGRPVSRFSRAPASASFSLMQVFTAAPLSYPSRGGCSRGGAASAQNARLGAPSVAPGGGPRLRPRLHNVPRLNTCSPFQAFLYRCCCCLFSRVFAPVSEIWTQKLIVFLFSTRHQFPVPKSKGRKACLGRPFTWR